MSSELRDEKDLKGVGFHWGDEMPRPRQMGRLCSTEHTKCHRIVHFKITSSTFCEFPQTYHRVVVTLSWTPSAPSLIICEKGVGQNTFPQKAIILTVWKFSRTKVPSCPSIVFTFKEFLAVILPSTCFTLRQQTTENANLPT